MGSIEVKTWRRAERERLIALRMAMSPAERRAKGEPIAAAVREIVAGRPGILGIYWPFRAEFDPRPLVDTLVAAGREVALPVVIDKKGPLEYRAWAPGDPLTAGVWDIPIPERREIVLPTMVLAPLVGFDRAGYRLGYGGGYFDRTLGAMDPRPLAIGVGFACQAIDTIYPQPFDIAMDVIVTEAGAVRR
ncbi:MAG TPA: 5-formyltetrahydrofolate cyclo-ligase [Stellaceae bacterium]|jgi:5-formyltetrahydrofolate cyclo-ligase|nr:5-formyltetrahydrofolate cyclo-ligase [Stellaceae bacterium]